MPITLDLTGKTALVTGGSRGLGAAICRQLARAGAAVVVHYATSADRAEGIVKEIQAAGGKALAVGADFHDAASAGRAIAEARAKLGDPDIVVNNAGREEATGPALELGWDDYEAIFELNVRSAYLTSRAAAPHMRHQKWGRIINILSMAAHTNPKTMASYTTAKAALGAFTRALAVELGSDGITVNSVSPGWIPVERHGPGTLPGRIATAQRTPLGHLGSPDDVASTVTFLASDLAGFITGVEIPVCGGVHMLG